MFDDIDRKSRWMGVAVTIALLACLAGVLLLAYDVNHTPLKHPPITRALEASPQ